MHINKAKKIVIKLGSSTVIDKKGSFKKKWLLSLIEDIKKLKKNKQEIVLVSSGAIALGQSYLKIKNKKVKLEMSQAVAAVGQIHLINEFQKLFEKKEIDEKLKIFKKKIKKKFEIISVVADKNLTNLKKILLKNVYK